MVAGGVTSSLYSCFLLVLLLLLCLSPLNGDSKVCHYKLLESAFEVQVDLERKDGGEMMMICSEEEKTVAADLIQKGIQKASKKLADNRSLRSASSFDASVCKLPAAKSTKAPTGRHLAGEEKQAVERSLRSRTRFFRYYGTMRCRICDRDDTDNGEAGTPMLSFAIGNSTYDDMKRAYLSRIPIATENITLEQVIVDFVIHQLQHDQNIFVIINQHYKFALNLQSATHGNNENLGIRWRIAPLKSKALSSKDAYKVILTLQKKCLPLWLSIIEKNAIDISVSFDNDEKGIPKIDKFNALLSAWPKKKNSIVKNACNHRQLVAEDDEDDDDSFTPLASPVSSPTTPTSSTSIMTSPAEVMTYVPPPRSLPNTVNQKQILTTTVTAISSDAKETPKEIKSYSTIQWFKQEVHRLLTKGLNDDLQKLLPSDHCMYGKGIHAKVHLTSKPEWEKKLPTCTNHP